MSRRKSPAQLDREIAQATGYHPAGVHKPTVKAREYRLGEIIGGKLHAGVHPFDTLERALRYVREHKVRRVGGVIIETQDLAIGGKIFGSRTVLRSPIDGRILPEGATY